MLSLRFRAAAAVLAAVALPLHAAPLSLPEALRLAQERTRLLAVPDAAAAAAREMAVAAGQRPDPVLKAGVNNLPVDGPDRFSLTSDFMTMRSVAVMQEWTRESKLKARAGRYGREAEVAAAERQLALASLQRDTAVAWLACAYQQRLRALLGQQRMEAQRQQEAAEAAYRGGRGAQADVWAARSALAQVDDRLAAQDSEWAVARAALARWIGPLPDEGLADPPPLPATLPGTAEFERPDWETALNHHPELAVWRRREDVAQAEADAARADREPDLSVELMFSQRGSAYSNMLSLNVSMPLQWSRAQRQDRELAARLLAVEQVRAQREELTRAHAAEVQAMWLQWRSGHERLKRYDEQLLPLAADRIRAALAAYAGGTTALTGVLDARRAELDLRLERLRLEMDTARLSAQLSYLAPAGTGDGGTSE